jgi:hypothetical protein
MDQMIAQLEFCGITITKEEKLIKTFSTFHASQILLQQQFRLRGFTKYSNLVATLLVAEQNNELLIKNHESRPTGTTTYFEINDTINGMMVIIVLKDVVVILDLMVVIKVQIMVETTFVVVDKVM